MRSSIKGQSIFEYAVIMAIVVASLVTMRIYIKRAIEGRLRVSADEIGELYSPLCVTSKFTTTQKSEIKEIELFGLHCRTNMEEIGTSLTEVKTASEVVRCATGADKETIYIDFRNEKLYD